MLHMYAGMDEMVAVMDWVGAGRDNDEEASVFAVAIDEEVGLREFRARLLEHLAFRDNRRSLA